MVTTEISRLIQKLMPASSNPGRQTDNINDGNIIQNTLRDSVSTLMTPPVIYNQVMLSIETTGIDTSTAPIIEFRLLISTTRILIAW